MPDLDMNILVVDDDPALLEAHALHLASLGYQVSTAQNGQQALEMLRENPDKIEAILSDIVMPGLDGYGLCKVIKNDPDTQHIPLIFVSQLTTLEEKVKGFSVGADDYIAKPIAPEELGLKIKVLLELGSKNKGLQQQLSETQDVAMQAMTYSSDMGQIVEFFKKTLAAENF